MISTGLRNEMTTMAGLVALGLFLRDKPRWALGTGALALGFQVLPVDRETFRNKSVVITGGSRGLGLALAEQFVSEGALITLLARDSDELKRASTHLESFRGIPVFTSVCDVTNRNQLKSSMKKVRDHFGGIDILINNAGSVTAGPFEAMNQADFEAQMNIHFFACLKSVQTVLPVLKMAGGGHIVNISSIGGQVAVPHMSAYCASKFALSGFSKALAAELAKDRIQVTTVYPGLMRTGSPVQGVFKGDSEKEFAWFAISDSTPGLSIPARKAARQILDAIREGRQEIVLSWPAKIGVVFHRNFPESFSSLTQIVNRLLPQGTSEIRKTGADSQSWIKNDPI